jgi:hypothetical protein
MLLGRLRTRSLIVSGTQDLCEWGGWRPATVDEVERANEVVGVTMAKGMRTKMRPTAGPRDGDSGREDQTDRSVRRRQCA